MLCESNDITGRGDIDMKKTARIFGLALALALVFSSVAFAVPGNVHSIEGLPELPSIPTMKTKNDGKTETITLSEPLAYLNVISRWTWMDIITFDEEGTTGTFSLDEIKNAQPGMDTWQAEATWISGYGESREQVGSDEAGWGVWINAGTSEEEEKKLMDEQAQKFYDAGLASKTGSTHYGEKWVETSKGVWEPVEDRSILVHDSADTIEFEVGSENEWGKWYNAYRVFTRTGSAFGVYDMEGYGKAFEGNTTDGVKVCYDRFGTAMEAFVTVSGKDFLDSGKKPINAEVHFLNAQLADGSWRWIVRSIKQIYTDGSSLNAQYAYNGTFDKMLK